MTTFTVATFTIFWWEYFYTFTWGTFWMQDFYCNRVFLHSDTSTLTQRQDLSTSTFTQVPDLSTSTFTQVQDQSTSTFRVPSGFQLVLKSDWKTDGIWTTVDNNSMPTCMMMMIVFDEMSSSPFYRIWVQQEVKAEESHQQSRGEDEIRREVLHPLDSPRDTTRDQWNHKAHGQLPGGKLP